ncbi:MAG: TatD family hydrolase [Desulfobacteraceae bacterium]
MSDIRFADSHAHLDLPEYHADQSQVIQRAWDAGVELIINIGISVDNSAQVLTTAQRYDQIYCTIGVHPHGVGNLIEDQIDRLGQLARHPQVVAVGEIGLDFYRRRAPEEVQKHWFRRQLELAHALGKPVVIHTREAMADTLAILREYAPRLCGGVMHCFGGSYEDAKAFLDLGLVLSLSGVLTYPKAQPLREVVKKLPLEGLLIETDAPYLAPQPRRGKRNEPAYLLYTAQTLAELKGLDLAQAAQFTWNNTRRVFGLESAP